MEIVYNDYKAGFPGILFAGVGSLEKLYDIVKTTNTNRVVVFVDTFVKELPIIQELFNKLGECLVGIIDDIAPEPSRDSIQGIYESAKALDGQLMVAIGGGSIMDMVKVVAVAMNNEEFAKDGFKDTSLIHSKGLPTIMVPTTAGTGAEATPNAIFLITEQELKVGVVSNTFVASYVILEPRVTQKLPKSLTAATGIDALCHAIESYISKMANPVSKVFSLRAVHLIANNLEEAYFNGSNLMARENMLLASFFAGMCLFSSTTVAVHALSYPLGGKYHIPHGISNAILLPLVLEANLPTCRDEYSKLAEAMIPQEMLKDQQNIPEAFVDYIKNLCNTLQIPNKLIDFGVKYEDIDYLADNALEVKRLLSQNPKVLIKEDIIEIYKKLL